MEAGEDHSTEVRRLYKALSRELQDEFNERFMTFCGYHVECGRWVDVNGDEVGVFELTDEIKQERLRLLRELTKQDQDELGSRGVPGWRQSC